eukprot:GHVU01161702.1.p1 GENE.GHVU01161702.1~~GHVU01161702.1.p1  ORF type:complete len:152 (+),score=11.08 GHVU01161702.1:720-1175(+)
MLLMQTNSRLFLVPISIYASWPNQLLSSFSPAALQLLSSCSPAALIRYPLRVPSLRPQLFSSASAFLSLLHSALKQSLLSPPVSVCISRLITVPTAPFLSRSLLGPCTLFSLAPPFLATESDVLKLVEARLQEEDAQLRGWVLDGFPRDRE